MPLGLMATTSSLWMNLPSASLKLAVPVYSVSAFSSMLLATSGLGQSWLGCMYEANSPFAETLTILPGTESGLKPAGGLAISASSSAAWAEFALTSALAATPAEATRKTSRRERFRDSCARFILLPPSKLRRQQISRAPGHGKCPGASGLRQRESQRWPARTPLSSRCFALLAARHGARNCLSRHAAFPRRRTKRERHGTEQNENRVRYHPAQRPEFLEPRGRCLREQRRLHQREARSGTGERGDPDPGLPAERRARVHRYPQPLARLGRGRALRGACLSGGRGFDRA